MQIDSKLAITFFSSLQIAYLKKMKSEICNHFMISVFIGMHKYNKPKPNYTKIIKYLI